MQFEEGRRYAGTAVRPLSNNAKFGFITVAGTKEKVFYNINSILLRDEHVEPRALKEGAHVTFTLRVPDKPNQKPVAYDICNEFDREITLHDDLMV